MDTGSQVFDQGEARRRPPGVAPPSHRGGERRLSPRRPCERGPQALGPLPPGPNPFRPERCFSLPYGRPSTTGRPAGSEAHGACNSLPVAGVRRPRGLTPPAMKPICGYRAGLAPRGTRRAVCAHMYSINKLFVHLEYLYISFNLSTPPILTRMWATGGGTSFFHSSFPSAISFLINVASYLSLS